MGNRPSAAPSSAQQHGTPPSTHVQVPRQAASRQQHVSTPAARVSRAWCSRTRRSTSPRSRSAHGTACPQPGASRAPQPVQHSCPESSHSSAPTGPSTMITFAGHSIARRNPAAPRAAGKGWLVLHAIEPGGPTDRQRPQPPRRGPHESVSRDHAREIVQARLAARC